MLNISVNAIQAMTENKEFFVEEAPHLSLRTRIQRLVTINGVLNRSAIRIDIEDNGRVFRKILLNLYFTHWLLGAPKAQDWA